jgi:hypothetical protein
MTGSFTRRSLLQRGGALLGGLALASTLPDPVLRRLGGDLWLPEARASGACFEPIPDPFAAGWTRDPAGTGGAVVTDPTGGPLSIVDNSVGDGQFVNLVCPADDLLASDIVLTPRVTLEPGFVEDAGLSTGVHVTINDGQRRLRVALLRGATSAELRVAIETINGVFSPGFVFASLTIEFTLTRTASGDAILSVGGPTDVVPLEQLPPTPVATKRLEFGTYNSASSANSIWYRLGLPARPAFAAQVQPPIDADGSSTFNANGGVVPLKFALTENGSPTCELPPATLHLTRTGGTSPGPIDESVYSGPADSGSEFRIADCEYHYNVSARALGPGSYLAEILIEGAVVGAARFELK